MPYKVNRLGLWMVAGVARFFGFVPISVMTETVEALNHKTRGLENQIALRKLLEDEVDFLRRKVLRDAENGSDVSHSITRLETIASNLTELMQSVWPQACLEDAYEPSESTAEILIS